MNTTSIPPTAHADHSWVPIRSLKAGHRDRIAAHLLRLDGQDRYLRFGYPASDEQIGSYVAALDFERDEVFGIFNRRLELIAMAHLARAETAPKPAAMAEAMAEFGVSVLRRARGRGYGQRLFEHAAVHARNRGVKTLFIHALSENVAMLKIARKAGAMIQREGAESDAWVQLPPDTFATHVEALVEEQAAEFDYHWKMRAQQLSELWGGLADTGAPGKPS